MHDSIRHLIQKKRKHEECRYIYNTKKYTKTRKKDCVYVILPNKQTNKNMFKIIKECTRCTFTK